MGIVVDTCIWVDIDRGRLMLSDIVGHIGNEDVWIAATAIQHGYRVLTRNKCDFEDVPGLNLIAF